MKSILEIIKPIKLLVGDHADTGTTGQGCMMNVISYLNGEPQITDASPCVCQSVRHIAIWLNDALPDHRRHLLIPYIDRAMGSATTDAAELRRRRKLLIEFARKCTEFVLSSDAPEYRETHQSRLYSVKTSLMLSAAAARCATCASSALLNHQAETFAAAFEFLDAALPIAPAVDRAVIDRAHDLIQRQAGIWI